MQNVKAGARTGAFETTQISGQGGSPTSAVAWAAIFGGAVAAVAATLILVVLGAGLGLTTVSPWPSLGATAKTFGAVAAIWLVVVQWIASGLGGFITGRLRTKWVGLHSDEVFFRDTAHGFLSWALATVVGVAFLASALSSALSGGTRDVATVASGAAQGAGAARPNRPRPAPDSPTTRPPITSIRCSASDNPSATASGGNAQELRAETTQILTTDLRNGGLTPPDRTYLARLVAAKAGIDQTTAEQRVDAAVAQLKDAETKARQDADAARKTTAAIALITALSMVIGAFIASAAGALGGRIRDAF